MFSIGNIINLIHFLLVLFLLISVFVDNYQLKTIALTLLIFTFIQFITNYGKCGLTEIEYMVRGEKYSEGFIYRLVKPIITLPEKYFDQYLHVIHIIWIFILYFQIKKIKFKV